MNIALRVEKVFDPQLGEAYKVFPADGVYPQGGMHFSELIDAVKSMGYQIDEENWSWRNANEFFPNLLRIESIQALIVASTSSETVKNAQD